jgi:DNA invertase Pin-like site-specific DNA recombinase
MKVKYVRVSTKEQNTDRQKVNLSDFDKVYEDYVSGGERMERRKEGSRLLADIVAGKITELSVGSIDRLGRDVADVMNTLKLCEEKKVNVIVENYGIHSMDKNGKPNDIFKLISGIVSTLAESERRSIGERCTQGRNVARARGVRFGRKEGDVESLTKFLSKPKVKMIQKTLKNKPYLTIREVSGIHSCSFQLVMKVRKHSSL